MFKNKKKDIVFSYGCELNNNIKNNTNKKIREYYLLVQDNKYTRPYMDYDECMAEYINLTEEEYKYLMIHRFNAYLNQSQDVTIYFETEEDVDKAVEFMNITYKLLNY